MNTKHLLYLDSLRGSACMVVVFFHTLIFTYPGLTRGSAEVAVPAYSWLVNYPPFSLLIAGQAAVCLFFIHSGFVLSYKYIDTPECKTQVIVAIVKRPFRLAGVTLFTTLPVVSFLLTKDFWFNRLWVDYDIYLRCVYNILMNPLTANINNNPPLWTIGTELWGSFLVFGFCLIIGNWIKVLRIAILLSLIICFKNTFYFSFIFGVLLADFHKNWKVDKFLKYKNTISYVFLIPAIICCSYQCYLSPASQYWHDIEFIMGGYPMIGAMSLFTFILCNDRIKQILEFKPLVFLGGISYSVYVLHWLMLSHFIHRIMGFVTGTLGLNSYFSLALIVVINTSFLIVAAWLVDKWVDKPCIKFSALFAQKLVSEIQSRLKVVRNMATAAFQKIKALITSILHKYGYSQESWFFIQLLEKNDKLLPATESDDTVKEDNNEKIV